MSINNKILAVLLSTSSLVFCCTIFAATDNGYLTQDGEKISACTEQTKQLIQSIYRQDDSEVEALLQDKNRDINATDGDGITALMAACAIKNYNYVERICNIDGVNVNARNRIGKTALIMLCEYEKPNDGAIINLLIKKGADVNVQENNGYTALMHAAFNYCNTCISILLLVPDIKVDTKNLDGETALDLARQSENTPGIEMLRMYDIHHPKI